MKNLLLLLTILGSSIFLKAQDMIILNSGAEIEATIVEVGISDITYLKYDYLDGPSYVISKEDVFMIKYENGSKDVFGGTQLNKEKPKATKKDIRRGAHLGFHFTPGLAGIITENNNSVGFGINAGTDLNIYFNNYVGLKTGLVYSNLPVKFEGGWGYPYEQTKTTGNIGSLGIPIKFLLTTGTKVGFYFETGICVYIPAHSHYTTTFDRDFGSHDGNYKLADAVIAGETVLGLNVKTSEIMSLNFGLSSHYSLTGYLPNQAWNGYLIGLQVGFLFDLSH